MNFEELILTSRKNKTKSKVSDPAEKISLVRLTTLFAGGNILSQLLSMVAGLLVARVTNPEDMGLFSSITLILGYVVFLNAGIPNGLNRQLPYYIGKGLKEESENYAAVSQAWSLLLSSFVGLAFIAISGWNALNTDWDIAIAYFVLSFSAFHRFYVTDYLQITYRTRGDFVKLSKINITKNIFSVIFVVFVSLFGYYGLWIRLFFIEVVDFILNWRSRPLRVKPKLDWAHLKDLFKIGIPIMGAGQLYAWWSTLNSTLVLSYFGTQGLGLYHLPVIISSAITILFNSFSQILYPKMVETYGKNEDIRGLIKIAARPLLIMAISTVIIIVVGWISLPYLVPIILPQYQEAIAASQWILVASFPLCLNPITTLFHVIQKVQFYILSIAISIGVYYIVLRILIYKNMTLTAFPKALFVGRAVMIMLTLIFIYILQTKEHKKK